MKTHLLSSNQRFYFQFVQFNLRKKNKYQLEVFSYTNPTFTFYEMRSDRFLISFVFNDFRFLWYQLIVHFNPYPPKMPFVPFIIPTILHFSP